MPQTRSLSFLSDKIFERLRDMGLIREGRLHQLTMQDEYAELRKTMRSKDAIEAIAEKFFHEPNYVRNVVYWKEK